MSTILAVGSLILTKVATLQSQQSKQDAKKQIDDLEKQIEKLKGQLWI